LWERACPANTGEAGAMHRGACIAGKPASTGFGSRLPQSKGLGNLPQKSPA